MSRIAQVPMSKPEQFCKSYTNQFSQMLKGDEHNGILKNLMTTLKHKLLLKEE